MSRTTIKLHLRKHTAKAVTKWCADPMTGEIKVSNTKALGVLIHAHIVPVPAPIETVYEGLPEVVAIYLTERYDHRSNIEWRRWTRHIDRPSMRRIDKYINDLLMLVIYERWQGAEMSGQKEDRKVNKSEVVRDVLSQFDITDDDIRFETVYDYLRRVEREQRNSGRQNIINSLS